MSVEIFMFERSGNYDSRKRLGGLVSAQSVLHVPIYSLATGGRTAPVRTRQLDAVNHPLGDLQDGSTTQSGWP